ncbi:hypothetical protein Tco_1200562 [Tanacetum coccineum]
MNDLESDDESVDTLLVSPFPHSDNYLDDGEVFNELIEYENVGMLHPLGWHLEEIHVTWAYLENKQTRLWTCTKIHQEVLFSERGDDVAGIKRRCRYLSSDGVWILVMASQRSQLKVDLDPST